MRFRTLSPSKRLVTAFAMLMHPIFTGAVIGAPDRAICQKAAAPGHVLTVATQRDEFLPYEPIHLCVWLTNESDKDGEIENTWLIGIRFEFRAVGEARWTRFEVRRLIYDPAPSTRPFKARSSLSMEEWIDTYDYSTGKPLWLPGIKYEIRAATWHADKELASNVLTIAVNKPDGADGPANTELLEQVAHLRVASPKDPVDLGLTPSLFQRDIPDYLRRIRAFVELHPESRYSIYFRRTFAIVAKQNPKVEDVHAFAAAASHWLKVHAEWAALDAQCATQPSERRTPDPLPSK